MSVVKRQDMAISSHGPAMVKIPQGFIEMRDDRIKQKWTVAVSSFFLAKVPVSQALYFAVMNHSPSAFTGRYRPVEKVSWMDAVAFCNQLSVLSGLKACYYLHAEGQTVELIGKADGFRLPMDAEWEYACKGGTSGPRYDDLDSIAWYKGNAGGETHDVGLKKANAWDLYDMLGNVWEWCWDLYDEKNYGPYRIMRGGGWNDPARGCLATNRRRSHPDYAMDDLGFRVARSLTLAKQ